ncbi:hypothetical protein ACETAC_09445 [Aceticella autotrophica]|uniref:Copper amine oxidase-like N-terminal domain-containing protein n=1 Tax=Aceticella autotrophica TaxID=2755338 RepID=A0A975AV98_9THEO|nr:stalk domain-containing protein [Aceticella autotrophica]QSZ27078.1 hypothetical protein ACETAC_09445 [Aceticella autotrophica]
MKKKLCFLMIFVLLLSLFPILGLADTPTIQPVKILFNNMPIDKEKSSSIIVNGRTMVSSEFFSDNFGAEVKWEPITQTIIIQGKNVNIKLIIGKKEVVINGENRLIDVEPLLMFDKKMVPLKFVSEALGAQVKWNDETEKVEVITSNVLQKTTSEYNLLRVLAEQTAKFALKTLGNKGDFMVLTNAGYAIIDNKSTSPCLDGITSVIGCTSGNGNLLEIHTADSKPLWFFFYEKNSGNGIFIEMDGIKVARYLNGNIKLNDVKKDPSSFFKIVDKENIASDNLLANPDAWNQKIQKKVFDGYEFAIVTIANIASKGAPAGLIKSALFHDHLCPGVTSGYIIANYLKKEFPLRSPSESYYILAVPPWCKEDALQVILNTTPGKGGMAVIPMNDNNKKNLKPDAQNLAGIYFRYDSVTKKGDGVVLSFDFSKAQGLSGINMNKGFPWESRLKLDIWLLNYLEKPQFFINVIKSFELKPGEVPTDYAQPGVNPLVKLDLIK